jgi:hypothetical protein
MGGAENSIDLVVSMGNVYGGIRLLSSLYTACGGEYQFKVWFGLIAARNKHSSLVRQNSELAQLHQFRINGYYN